MIHTSRIFQLLILAGFIAAGCGGNTPTPSGEVSSGPLLPWKAGNRWTYRVTDDGEVSEMETTVGAPEPVGGTGPSKNVIANKVITRKGTADKTISWQAAVGASWLEIYQETKLPIGEEPSTETVRERWTVLANEEPVTVPAGTFRVVVLQKAGGSKTKTYWYVRGIGKVKETGGQTEELVSFEVMP